MAEVEKPEARSGDDCSALKGPRYDGPCSIDAIAAVQVGDAVQGILRDGAGVGQEAEAEEGGERQCDGAFHDPPLRF
jgi:hypothetical protein